MTEELIEGLIVGGIKGLSALFAARQTVRAGGELTEEQRAAVKAEQAANRARLRADIDAALVPVLADRESANERTAAAQAGEVPPAE